MTEPRQSVRQVVVAALDALDLVDVASECGSEAFGRADDGSDVDVLVVARDGSAEAVFAALDSAFASRFGIRARWRLPEPNWLQASQSFWKFDGLPETLLVDVAVFGRSDDPSLLLLAPERHGRGRLLVDHLGAGIPQPPPFDADPVRERIRTALADAVDRFELFAAFAPKEQRRGRTIDWLGTWHAHVVRPLVSVLNIRYRPLQYDFSFRYLHEVLPVDVATELVDLMQVQAGDDAEALLARARTLFDETVAGIDLDAVPLAELAAAARA